VLSFVLYYAFLLKGVDKTSADPKNIYLDQDSTVYANRVSGRLDFGKVYDRQSRFVSRADPTRNDHVAYDYDDNSMY
jgi:hypothetical protein